MHQRSWDVRLVSQTGAELSTPVAMEVQSLFYEVARDAEPRSTVKGKLRYICDELAIGGPYPAWRAHEGWYGRGRNWSYAAVRDLQDRVKARRDRRAKLAAEQETTRAMLAAQQDAAALKAARAVHIRALEALNLRLRAMGLDEEAF